MRSVELTGSLLHNVPCQPGIPDAVAVLCSFLLVLGAHPYHGPWDFSVSWSISSFGEVAPFHGFFFSERINARNCQVGFICAWPSLEQRLWKITSVSRDWYRPPPATHFCSSVFCLTFWRWVRNLLLTFVSLKFQCFWFLQSIFQVVREASVLWTYINSWQLRQWHSHQLPDSRIGGTPIIWIFIHLLSLISLDFNLYEVDS